MSAVCETVFAGAIALDARNYANKVVKQCVICLQVEKQKHDVASEVCGEPPVTKSEPSVTNGECDKV